MKKKTISKNKMAALLKTSRTQVDRLLSAKDDIRLGSLGCSERRQWWAAGLRLSLFERMGPK